MKKTEAIQHFLKTAGNTHLTNLYTPEMEVQVNVAQDNGRRTGGEYIGKRWVGWTDGQITWKSFRIPWSANTNPEYVDSDIRFNLAEHVEGIGMTGWNWVTKSSLWVGYDFDSIANHKEGLSPDELKKVKDLVCELPYATLVKSTSGKGIHLYIHLSEPVRTETHSEHAALARSILSVLSMQVGFNFFNSVDACGMVLWVYHRKQENTDGLSLIKKGDKFPVSLIPTNWKDHVEVTSGKRRKIRCVTSEESPFEELISSVRRIDLDDEHKRLLNWFSKNTSADRDSWWDSDNNMLVCHTFDLAKAHKDLSLRGIFYTNSSGSSRQNCFAFPADNGSWVIRRHSQGVQEHPSWSLDPSGWTRCVYNAVADLSTCSRANKGIENSGGELVFPTIIDGLKSLMDAGINNIGLEPNELEFFRNRTMFIKEKADGRVIVAFTRESHDILVPNGFLVNKKGDRWEKVVHVVKQKREVQAPDYLIRHVIADDAEAGWWIYTRKKWIQESRANVSTVLLSQHTVDSRIDIEMAMSKAILNPWELVNIPFSDEYPGNRQWNRDAATFSTRPEEGSCPTWLKVIEHCGKNLDSYIKVHPWCVENAINTGAEYLLVWISNMFQRPAEPLPYLFFVGPQNCGKSTLHEALSKLMVRGYSRADNALINQQGFNSEISNAVLCIVEETNLNKNRDAANRIKDWVTGKTISINTKHRTVYDIVNTTHWMQCANDIGYCPIFPGDTRIVVCRVDALSSEVPKQDLFEQLEKEKSAFLHLVLSIELPAAPGRLAVPCINTVEKEDVAMMNASQFEIFMKECVHIKRGHTITFEDLFMKFISWLPANERNNWTKMRVSRMYPKEFPYCKGALGSNNTTTLGNISFNENAVEELFEYYTDSSNRLQRRMF